ncbi:MAG: hypothetical protein JSW23_00155 [Planctomycetota bacterium]|nr:MAG: hypothetical protein JSW23_00155 [Planctomycetota bacterium]
MAKIHANCKGCRWWNLLSKGQSEVEKGECRRYPPSVFFFSIGVACEKYCDVSERGFPITSADCWCGEAHF